MRKVLAATMTCLMVLFGIVSSFDLQAQNGKFDVRIKLKNSDCAAKKITIQVQVKAHDANSKFKMGDANFRFDYDPTVVKNPVNVLQENFSNVAPASDLNYVAQTLTGSKVTPDGKMGIVSLNVLYSGSNADAKLVGTDYMTVACLQFDIVNTSGCVNFRWHTDNASIDFPITGMNEIIVLTPDPFDYTNPVVLAGGLFENLNQCIAPLCSAPAVDAVRDFFTTNINTFVTGNALSNDSPTTGLTVKTATLGTPLHGSISMSSTGAFTYTPSMGYVGKDSVEYEACNSSSVCDKAFIVINITGPAPVAVRDPYTLSVGTSVSGNILTNDTPAGGLTVKISPFPTPLHGGLTLSTNGFFTYTPQIGYVGKDSVQYQACNGNNVCATAYLVFTITGTTVIPVAVRDTYSTVVNTPIIGKNILTNDIGVTSVKISPFPTPLHGSLTLSTNGNFTYTPTTDYVGKDSIQYEACNASSQCSKAYAVFTIAPNPNAIVDLSLTKTVNQKKAVIGDIITYTITLKNEGINPATGVSVKDFMPAGVLYQTYATAFGTYDNATGIWTIGNVPVGQTLTLLISVKTLYQGTFFNRAEIWTCNEQDVDSQPANSPLIDNQTILKNGRISATTNPLLEDDNGTACFYIPVEICDGSGDEFTITVPAGYSQIQWYKDDVAIIGATFSTLKVSTPGKYTFTTYEGTCPAGGCCPAEFVIVSCCKPNVCVPYSVVKTKSAKK
jgi:uncharacterized repeat protein (TIGR01451 family)